jgi:hypothetical protein
MIDTPSDTMIDDPDKAAPEFVPPLVIGNTPLTCEVNPTLPHDGAAPIPPLISTLPVAISASRENVVGALA